MKKTFRFILLTAIALILPFAPLLAENTIDLPALPDAVASFGAAVHGDALYVYGGHVGKTHAHSIQNLSHRFHRLPLNAPEKGWEDLGEAPGLQGLPMIPTEDGVCRVGGLSARNQQGDEENLVSLADVRCFRPADGVWHDLPPMPTPRSSHDAAVSGGKLYVVGGWQLRGAGQEPVWPEEIFVLDLTAKSSTWRTIAQPFQRRALAVAAAGGKIYALGGLGDDGTSRRVDVFDTASETWSIGPELPKMRGRLKGFGVSAFGVDDRVYLSGADGVVHALDAGADAWSENLGKLEEPRFFHRLLPHGDHLYILGGASREGHLSSMESIDRTALDLGKLAFTPEPEPPDPAEIARAAWPGFRGRGDGHAPSSEAPRHWSSEEGVVWRADLPGIGQSAPVVWNEQVFVTSTEGPNKEWLILTSLALDDGEIRWRRRFPAGQKIESSDMVSRSAPTPAADADRVYAFWESGDLIALDHEGETLWHRSLTEEYGDFEGNHGVASSPVLTENAVIVQATHEGPSYFLAVDQSTGENVWKSERPSKVAWTTPVVVQGPNGAEILSSAAGRVEALDAATGELLWQVEGIEKNHVPSIVVQGDLVIAASSDPGQSLALRRPTEGTEAEVIWRAEGVASGFGSPLIQGDCVLFTNKSGGIFCLDRTSGEELWRHRAGESSWASPVAVGEDVFFFTKKGETVVLRPGADGPEVVAQNPAMSTGTVYGAAVVRDAVLIRTGEEIVRIGSIQTEENETVASANASAEAGTP